MQSSLTEIKLSQDVKGFTLGVKELRADWFKALEGKRTISGSE